MSIAAKVGDLFAVPLAPNAWGIGVVASKWKRELYLVLFSARFDDIRKARDVDISALTPVLASSSLDAKIWHGHWPILKGAVDTSPLVQPIYKVDEGGGLVAESFDRSWRRSIDLDLARLLRFRKGVAPVRLENALKAYHGTVEWDPVFDELRYENVLRSTIVRAADEE